MDLTENWFCRVGGCDVGGFPRPLMTSPTEHKYLVEFSVQCAQDFSVMWFKNNVNIAD